MACSSALSVVIFAVPNKSHALIADDMGMGRIESNQRTKVHDGSIWFPTKLKGDAPTEIRLCGHRVNPDGPVEFNYRLGIRVGSNSGFSITGTSLRS